MTEKIFNHPLRKIVLKYDENTSESDYEKEPLQAYLIIHDKSEKLIKQFAKLHYDYKVFDDLLEAAEKNIMPIVEKIDDEHARLPFLLKDPKNKIRLLQIREHLTEYFSEINSFQQNHVTPIQEQSGSLFKQLNDFENADEKLDKEFSQYHQETCKSLYREFDMYSLDLISYDEDQNNLCESFSYILKRSGDIDVIIKRYQILIGRIKALYDKWNEIKSWLD